MHPVESLAIEIYLRKLNANQLSDGPYRDEDMEIDGEGGFIRMESESYPDGYNYTYWDEPRTARRNTTAAVAYWDPHDNITYGNPTGQRPNQELPPPIDPPRPVTRYRLTSSITSRFVRNCVNEAKEILREVAIRCDGLDKTAQT